MADHPVNYCGHTVKSTETVLPSTPLDGFYSLLFGEGLFLFEPQEAYFQEKLLQAIWNEQLVHESLRSVAGQDLRVIHRGVWNVESGPDFHDAVIVVDGVMRRGSIEIHHQPEQWTQHHHQHNRDYDNVVLHVVWNNPHGHREYPLGIPLITLETCIDRPLAEIIDTINLTAYPYARQVPPGELAQTIAHMNDGFLRDLFQSYGIAHILHKAQRICAEITASGLEQTVYTRLLDAMGYKSNREPFAQLADALPLERLAQVDNETGLAMLLGAGGLLPDPSQQPVLDQHRFWLRRLWQAWWPHHKSWRPIRWNRQRMRPYNAPERRVLAAWLFLVATRHRPGQALIDVMSGDDDPAHALQRLRDLFARGDSEIYHPFYDFTRQLSKPAALLGESRINDLIVNLAVPLLFASGFLHADPALCQRGRAILAALPRLQNNRVLTEACHFLFVPPTRAAGIIRNACAQQGVLKVYRDWCHA